MKYIVIQCKDDEVENIESLIIDEVTQAGYMFAVKNHLQTRLMVSHTVLTIAKTDGIPALLRLIYRGE